jgi:hypothetical protein
VTRPEGGRPLHFSPGVGHRYNPPAPYRFMVAASWAETVNAWSVRREVTGPVGPCPSMTQEPNAVWELSWMGKFRTTVERSPNTS